MKLLSLALSLFVLSACSPEIPKCSDPRVIDTLKNMTSSRLVNSTPDILLARGIAVLDSYEIEKTLLIKDIRVEGIDKTIGQYSCAANLEYDIQNTERFTDNVQNIVTIGGVTSYIDGHRENYAQQIADAIESVYSPSEHKVKMAVHYTTQLLDNKEIYLSFDVKRLEFNGFQIALSMDKKYNNEKALKESSKIKEENLKGLLNDLAPKNNSRARLNAEELSVISKMPQKFEQVYKSDGIEGVKVELNKCYEAASQLKERTLTIQCMSFDAVACAAIPSIEKSESYPRDSEFYEDVCFKRAQEASEFIYTNAEQRDEFAKTIVQDSVKELEKHFSK